MDDWLEEDLLMLLGEQTTQGPRVFDQRMIREPIRTLNPGPPVTVAPATAMAEAVDLMKKRGIGCVLVVDGGRLTGIVTERDVLLKVVGSGRDLQTTAVADFMTPDPEALRPQDGIAFALNKMSVGGFRHVPLVDDCQRPVGVVSMRMIVDYLVEFFPREVLNLPSEPGKDLAREREGA
jgi:signal-transduction protein with cAMP-binding, CBS, and nucleotidyltransferase domain